MTILIAVLPGVVIGVIAGLLLPQNLRKEQQGCRFRIVNIHTRRWMLGVPAMTILNAVWLVWQLGLVLPVLTATSIAVTGFVALAMSLAILFIGLSAGLVAYALSLPKDEAAAEPCQ